METDPEAPRGYEALVHDRGSPAAAGAGRSGQAQLEFASGTGLLELIETLRYVFATDPVLDRVLLVPDGRPVGSTARVRFEQQVLGADPRDGDPPRRGGLGLGDHATLPGSPTSFTAYCYRCGQCGRATYRIAADEAPPVCPVAGHGAMVIAR
ncbi:hypothetical protein GCM10011583_35090 [Streptomyces camponoticapitis]|uniref:Uncharacterized protein n=1 Tax=Streptomyces camponoticapitis TaxID=1616125 RepID=A0ABQ2E8H0_9ACTN|nr:hypothetical protein [Streptomyces camponoticapitis]GGK00606.1 hypothetical protein GCM10011583_35090 [Streptomyces camponoticapitis]